MAFDEYDPEQEAAESQRLLDSAKDRDAWNWLMADARGRRIARWVLDRSGLLHRDCSKNEGHARFREGQRSAGADLLTMVGEYAPEYFTTLFKDDDDVR